MQVHSEEAKQATANKHGTIWRIPCNRPTVYSIDILDTRLASFQWMIIKDHQKAAMVQAQRVWNVWNWRALFQFFESICCLTHCLLNSTCVNWHQRYSINKRPSLAVECTAALGARASQSVEAGSGHCWFEPRNSKIKKLGRTGNKAPGYRKLQLSGVRGSSFFALLCLLLWFHQQMSRTFKNTFP